MEELRTKLDRIFAPKVVAVVGAKALNNYSWLRSVSTFKGKVYHVNMDRSEWPGAEALGFPNVASLLDIPEPVDYVIVSVPNKATPFVLRDCAAKGVGAVHLFTAGFSEMATEEGQALERTIVGIAKDAGIPMVGPNCMGVFAPRVGLRQGAEQYTDVAGAMGYISQSGSQAMGFAAEAHDYGLYVSKSISMGNGSVVDSHDWLDYLTYDDETKIVGMYLEGVRDGRKFFEALRAATARKPVVVWKVGQTQDAARAGQFHTGSLAIAADLWDAMLRQAGAVKVNSLDEMIDTAKGLLNLEHLAHVGAERRAALFALSGGHASEIADVFGRYGYGVPALSQESYDELSSFALIAGGSFRNPFEGAAVRTEEMMGRALAVVDRDPNIDLVAMELSAALPTRGATALADRIATIQAFRAKSRKPFIAVLSSNFPRVSEQLLIDLDRQLTEAGIPAFRGMERGARALRNALDYQAQRAWLTGAAE